MGFLQIAHVSTEMSQDHRDTPFHFLIVNLSFPAGGAGAAVVGGGGAAAAAGSVEEEEDEGGGGGLVLFSTSIGCVCM